MYVTFSQTLSVSIEQAVLLSPLALLWDGFALVAQLLRASLWREVRNLEFKSFKF